jgi:predicted metal-dependent hydrolase
MDLPKYPPKGQRRSLDQLWLTKIEREYRATWLGCVPARPPKLSAAVAQFNQRQYWQCHEVLEEIWLPEEYPLRLFYHGLIKAAVGLFHLERNNRRGASSKLKDAERTLAPFIPEMMGFDISRLRADINNRLALIESEPVSTQDAIDSLPAVIIHDTEIHEPS